MAEHSDKGEYNKRMPTKVAVPNVSGYPNKVASTQNTRIRGTKHTSRGNKFNSTIS